MVLFQKETKRNDVQEQVRGGKIALLMPRS